MSEAGIAVGCPRCIGFQLQISRLEEDLERKRRMNTELYDKYEKHKTENALLCKEIKNIIKDTGGHFCKDWDYLFVLPKSKESECCTCEKFQV